MEDSFKGILISSAIITLFMRADLIVKSVIIILIVSSIYSWALIFEKHKIFKKINLTSNNFEKKFWDSKSAQEIYKKTSEKDEEKPIQEKRIIRRLIEKIEVNENNLQIFRIIEEFEKNGSSKKTKD